MSRPTTEEVDHALALNDAGVSYMPTQDVPELPVADVLAAEVRALRAELERWREGELCLREPDCECHQEEGDDECPVHDAREKLARVEALHAYFYTGVGAEQEFKARFIAAKLGHALKGSD